MTINLRKKDYTICHIPDSVLIPWLKVKKPKCDVMSLMFIPATHKYYIYRITTYKIPYAILFCEEITLFA